MLGEEELKAVLYALFHDLGKPVQRLARRHVEGVEHVSDRGLIEALRALTGVSMEELAKTRHDAISDKLYKWFLGVAPSDHARRILREVLSRSDPLAAAERGFEERYRACMDRLSEVFKGVKERLGVDYNYYVTPLLSPTWILYLTGYRRHVGPGRVEDDRFSSAEARGILVERLRSLLEAIEGCDVERIIAEESRILGEFMDKELWIPVRLADPRTILELRAYRYMDAVRRSSYTSIVDPLVEGLAAIKSLYEGHVTSIGVLNTVTELLRSLLMFVPSAAFASILPDIGLFSHTKLVTAYTAGLVAGDADKLRLLVVDANGIQAFISSPVKAKAASRVIRGRSLLVELAMDAVARYTLALFGWLLEANVVVSEGGTLDIIVPGLDDQDMEARVEKLRKVLDEFSRSELNFGLWFTVAYSKCFGLSDASFLHALRHGEGGFPEVLESLSRSLAVEKAKRPTRALGVALRHDEVEGFDTITLEPVPSDKLRLGYAMEVSEALKDYVDEIAGPGKLEESELLSETTHLSLVAGTLARNLIAIIAFYAYRVGEDGLVEPHSEAIGAVVKLLKEKLGISEPIKLTCDVAARPVEAKAGIVPFKSVGAAYLLVSSKEPYNPLDERDVRKAWSLLAGILGRPCASALTEALSLFKDVKLMVRVLLVNTATLFIPVRARVGDLPYDEVKRFIQYCVSRGVDVGFGYILTNTYHPAKLVEAETKWYKLVDLDEYPLIALAKMDVDYMGEVRGLLAFSPSRLAMFSDLLNAVLAAKTYLGALEVAEKLGREGRLLDVIPLYAGGDDVTVYGRWSHVVYMVSEIYKRLVEALYPLSMSGGVSIDRGHVPILDLYSRTLELLDEAKKVRASVLLVDKQPREMHVAQKLVRVDVLPFRAEDPWPLNDEATKWSLEVLASLLDPLRLSDTVAKLGEFKRELYVLARLGFNAQEVIERLGGVKTIPSKDRLRLEVAYAYLWSRRERALKGLVKALSDLLTTPYKPRILAFPDETIRHGLAEALRVLAAAKPVLDHLLLALRRPDTVEATRAR